LRLKEIIYNALKEYGDERDENIIINDLDEWGYELWDYRGDTPLYLFIEVENGAPKAVINMTLDEDTQVTVSGYGSTSLKNFSGTFYSMNKLHNQSSQNATKIKFGSRDCYVAKIEYGETAGYHRTPLVYHSDLILNTGETVTNLLDKLTAMLGDFEYFYDLNGRFVF
jgi:hypothetical protein